jgi:hypothetical protein
MNITKGTISTSGGPGDIPESISGRNRKASLITAIRNASGLEEVQGLVWGQTERHIQIFQQEMSRVW